MGKGYSAASLSISILRWRIHVHFLRLMHGFLPNGRAYQQGSLAPPSPPAPVPQGFEAKTFFNPVFKAFREHF